MLFLVGSDMVFWTAIIDGYMRHGEMNRVLEEFSGIYIFERHKTTEKLHHHQIWPSSPWHKVLLEPRPKQSTDTPCIYAQAPYEM